MAGERMFADAIAGFDESRYVIVGAPYDMTGTHMRGSDKAPDAIRAESYNFETYLYDLGIELTEIPFHDAGNVGGLGSHGEMDASLSEALGPIIKAAKIPIVLGGEHSISPTVVRALGDVSVLVLDAHLDFRDSYEGDRNNHSCASRRMSELVGVDRILPIGIRSVCFEEMEDARRLGLEFLTVERTTGHTLDSFEEYVRQKLGSRIYISLDMDAVDPAYAPGVGTPEPFGLEPVFIRDLIRRLAKNVVGMDIVEVCPPQETSITAGLAAKLVRDFIGAREKALAQR